MRSTTSILRWLFVRLLGSFIVGSIAGVAGGAISGFVVAAIEIGDVKRLIESFVGVVYLALLCALYGAPSGLVAGICSISLQPFVRRRHWLDALLVFLIAALVAWKAHTELAVASHNDSWRPTAAYLHPRTIAAALSCASCGWLLGRKGESAKRRSSALDWRRLKSELWRF